MYDDDVQTPISVTASDRYYKVAKFPTRNIKTPIILIYGGNDSLVDIHVMLRELPRHTIAKEIPHFEHLDFLWAQQVGLLVFPHVFEALDGHSGRDHVPSTRLSFAVHNGSADEDINRIQPDIPTQALYCETDLESAMEHSTYSIYRSPPIALRKGRSLPRSSHFADCASVFGDNMDNSKRPELRWNTGIKHERKRSGSTSSHRSFDGIARFGKTTSESGQAMP